MIIKKITLLGHKDHGKSTLIGSMLILTDRVNPAKLKEAKRISELVGTRFEPGYILDSFNEERVGALTIDTTRTEKIPYKDLAFEFIDVPGHHELIKNMISGASYADLALLIVSAKREEGIMDQTKRHLFIARMLGIHKLAVAVNKMDLVGYKRERFEEIKKELSRFIERIGFKRENVFFIPVSAYHRDNLITKSKKMSWYRGKHVLDLLYSTAKQDDIKPGKELRVVLQGFVTPSDPFIAGKVVSGVMKVNDKVSVLPSGLKSNIKEIVVKASRVRAAATGASVAFKLKNRISAEVRGSVLAGGSMPKVSNTVRALVFVTHAIGERPLVKFNGVDINTRSMKVLRTIDTTTGDAKRTKNPKRLDAIEAEFTFDKRVVSEDYEKTRELGRFVVFDQARKFAGIATVF